MFEARSKHTIHLGSEANLIQMGFNFNPRTEVQTGVFTGGSTNWKGHSSEPSQLLLGMQSVPGSIPVKGSQEGGK